MTQRGGKRPIKARSRSKPPLREVIESNGNPDQAEQVIQAPQEVPGPNTVPDYPYVNGYICVPEQLYNVVVDVIFQLPYGQVGRLAQQIENLSQIHKALQEAHKDDPPNEGDGK